MSKILGRKNSGSGHPAKYRKTKQAARKEAAPEAAAQAAKKTQDMLLTAVGISVVALVLGLTPFKEHEAWRASVGASWLQAGLHLLKGTMPENLAPYLP